VHFEGESVGVKAGGVLDETLREVTVKGRVTDIPEHLVLDIAGLEIGDTGKVSDLQVPDTIVIMADADDVLCTILAPRVEEETPAETAEPELVRKEKAGE
jgi:large subunit ribosomal protein L25